jgi:hypothetical protein
LPFNLLSKPVAVTVTRLVFSAITYTRFFDQSILIEFKLFHYRPVYFIVWCPLISEYHFMIFQEIFFWNEE